MNTTAATTALSSTEQRALRLLNLLGSSEWTRLARSTPPEPPPEGPGRQQRPHRPGPRRRHPRVTEPT